MSLELDPMEDPAASARPVVEDKPDVEGHRLAANDDETVVEDKPDVEGHRLAANDDETVVEDAD